MNTLKALASLLNQQASTTPNYITLSDTTLERDGVSALVKSDFERDSGDIKIVVNPGDIPSDPSGTSFKLAGTLPTTASDSFLSLRGNQVELEFSILNNNVSFTLTITLAPSWTLKTSYPFTDYSILKSVDVSSSPQPTMIFYSDPDTSVEPEIVAGNNLHFETSLTQVFEQVEQLLSATKSQPKTTTPQLSGRIWQGTSGQLADLYAPLGADFSLSLFGTNNAISLSDSRIGLRIQETTDESGNATTIQSAYVGAKISLANKEGTQVPLDILTMVGLGGGASDLRFMIHPPEGFVTTIDNIGSLIGGNTWDTVLAGAPNKLRQLLDEFGLLSFTANFSLSPFGVTSTMLTVGTLQAWDLADNFVIDSFSLSWLMLNLNSTSINTVSLEGKLTLLKKYKFDILIQVPKLILECSFTGELNVIIFLSDIVTAFGGTPISSDTQTGLSSFTFSSMSLLLDNSGTPMTMNFQCAGSIKIASVEVDFALLINIAKPPFDIRLALILGGYQLIGEYKQQNGDTVFDATWKDEDNPIGLETIIDALGFDLPEIPVGLDLALTELELIYNITKSELVFEATSKNYGKAIFVMLQPKTGVNAGKSVYLFRMLFGDNFNLGFKDLPLVGKVFDGDLGSIKNLQVQFASGDLSADDVTEINKLVQENPIPIPQGVTGTAVALKKGFNIGAEINLGSKQLPLTTGGAATAPVNPVPTQAPPAVPPAGNATWININQSIGPVTLDRIGVRYEKGWVWLLIDADFKLAMLGASLQGLSLGFKLPKKSESVDFAVQLNGMAIAYESGPLSIAGGFLRFVDKQNNDDYLGEASVKATSFSLMAIGGYAPKDSSFFIFVHLTAPLGGPPFFFITGLAGGLGINRSLVLPEIDHLTDYPLMPASNTFPISLGNTDPAATLAKTLGQVENYIYPQAGEYWLAAGLDFTSFEMIEAFALITVAFGVKLEIALLGVAHITVPKGDPEPIVYLEIALEARFEPDAGLIAVDGRITPASYIYAGLVHISGGFAFYIWYSGEHEGDFVVTIGGYNPRFTKPDHYPSVPRLQLVYQVGPLMIKGQAYFALVPHMLMAGLSIEATWQSGPIKAWFNAGIDFLLGWKPFHYEADAYIHLGASFTAHVWFVTIRITIHVGVDLSIWGPPFGGKAKIDLDIISFTIRFGDDPRQPTIDWPQFKESFLPLNSKQASRTNNVTTKAASAPVDPNINLCTAKLNSGMLQDMKKEDTSSFFSWMVDPNHFVIEANTVIPSKTAQYNDFTVNSTFADGSAFTYIGDKTGNDVPPAPTAYYDRTQKPSGLSWTDNFGVLPMTLASNEFDVEHVVELTRYADSGSEKGNQDPDSYTETVDTVSVAPIIKNSQHALWGATAADMNGDRFVNDTLVGFQLLPIISHPQVTLKADYWSMLLDSNKNIEWTLSTPTISTDDTFNATLSDEGRQLSYTRDSSQVTCANYELSDLTNNTVSEARNNIVSSLTDLGLAIRNTKINVSGLASYPLYDWPLIRSLGEEKASS